MTKKLILCIFAITLMYMTAGNASKQGLIQMDKVLAVGDIIYFPQPVYTIQEDCTTAEILIRRIRYGVFLITADYETADGTASAGSDYTYTNGTATMTMFLTDYIDIPVNDDSIGEADETFTITLTGQYTLHDPANGYYSSCTVVIQDNDGGISLSDNNNLSSLEISTGIMNPEFSTQFESYSVNLTDTVSTLAVRPTAEDSTASIEINGNSVQSGTWSTPVGLSGGSNIINVTVEAENGDERIYVIDANRDILPVVTVSTTSLQVSGSNFVSCGSSIIYNGTHTITVTDTSTTGWGFRIRLEADDFTVTDAGTVDDPCSSGSEWLEIKIPLESVCTVSRNNVIIPDLANDPVVFTDISGNPGIYSIEIDLAIEVDGWLPEDSIIVSHPSGTWAEVSAGDMIQIYGGVYNFGVEYVLERIIQP